MRRGLGADVMRFVLALVLALGCSDTDVAALQREAATLAVLEQPVVDALVVRTRALKRELRGNLPGWQDMLRTAELANDRLGLEPFTQTTPPGPGWRPSPTTLLGMTTYVPARARELAAAGQQRELQFLVDDAHQRYITGITDVAAELARVERQEISARTGTVSP